VCCCFASPLLLPFPPDNFFSFFSLTTKQASTTTTATTTTTAASKDDNKSQAEIDASFLKGPDDEYCYNLTMEATGASNQFYKYPNSLTAKEKSAELKKPYPSFGQGKHPP
jgi:hypothetical protein